MTTSSPTVEARTHKGRRRVSVVVPCRNERNHIAAFLDTLLEQQLIDIDLEIIVADGMSNDGTRDILGEYARRRRGIRVIDNPKGIVSTGLNTAICAASGDIIVRMDAHTEYASDYVLRCVETLEATAADNVGGPPCVRPRNFRMRVLGAAYHSPFAVGGAKSHQLDYEGYVDSVFYGCWRKSTLLKAGLFDESLVRNQDDELNLRLIQAGGKIWQNPRIQCWYAPRATAHDLFRQYFQYGFWKVAVIRKRRIPASWRHLVPGAFVLTHALLLATLLGSFLLSKPTVTSTVWMVWLAVTGAYAAASMIAAAAAAARCSWAILPFLPPLFFIYHTSYGVGFLAGLLYWLRPGALTSVTPRWASNLTR